MPINTIKEDEKSSESGSIKTLLRLFSYLLTYKKEIIIVLFIMAFCVTVNLINPLIIESAIDDYIGKDNLSGLLKIVSVAIVLNVIMILLIKLRMHIMNKVCNSILMTIRQELYTHIQTLDFHFF
ncbi:MAG: ABC transporter ATP-binding protein, partial [Acetatifactor sp.]|nr:ABC transporter ATP-binding protein [Acetatifactor sp.]